MTAARIHLILAGLMGLAGIALLAASSHAGAGGNGAIAGQMLLSHAPVVLGATAARRIGLLHDLLARIASTAIILGTAIFAADLARRGFFAEALFPRAAPIGGFLILGGWLALTIAALISRGQKPD